MYESYIMYEMGYSGFIYTSYKTRYTVRVKNKVEEVKKIDKYN